MEGIRLDKKDRRILDVLDTNPTLSNKQIAKKVGMNRQTVGYRIDTLLEQDTIYHFHTLVDVGRLGYSSFRVHLQLKNVSQDEYNRFAEELFHDYPAFWVAFISGSFDIILDFFATTPNEFKALLEDVLEQNTAIIQSYDTMIIYNMDLYEYAYFLEEGDRAATTVHRNTKEVEIDKTDEAILRLMKWDARMPYRRIGEEVGLSRPAVKQRIEKLEESSVIAGYKTFVNFNHFDKTSSKIFIKYDSSHIDQEEALLAHLRDTEGVLATLQLLGEWDLDIEIHTDDLEKLQQFMMELRNKFNLIQEYEHIQLLSDYGIDFYPEQLV